jgi:hypothetical protein
VVSHFGTSDRPRSPCGATTGHRMGLPETELLGGMLGFLHYNACRY